MRITLVFAAILLLCSLPLAAAPVSADAILTGFIQDVSVTNTSVSATITQLIYSLGPAAPGIATWDSSTAGGTASDFLSDPRWFQTVTWTGLSIAPGATFNASGLDIDYINSLVPLDVTGSYLDNVGSSLAGGYLLAIFDSGQTARASLVQQAWVTTQNLTLTEGRGGDVPEPSTLFAMAGGLAALGLLRARKSR